MQPPGPMIAAQIQFDSHAVNDPITVAIMTDM